MTEEEFVHICAGTTPPKKPEYDKIPAGLNESSKKTGSLPGIGKAAVTHPLDLNNKKHPRTACAWDAMGPYAGSGESGPFDGLADGEGAGIGEGAGAPAPGDGGGAMGESLSPKEFNACLEGLAEKYPESEAIPQIRAMFNSLQEGKPARLYWSADGCEATDDPMTSDADAAISAAAASVEAALSTFRRVAGYDYPGVAKN